MMVHILGLEQKATIEMTDFQCITSTQVDDVIVVSLNDHKVMDPSRIQLLGEELLSLASPTVDGHAPKLLINLENVRFLSSAAINKLIVLEKRMKAAGGGVKISNVSPEVSEVFTITHLNSVFEICEDQKDAIISFAS